MKEHTTTDGTVVRVYGDNILVEKLKLPETYEGSFIVVNREKEDATAIGIVRAVGTVRNKKTGEEVPIDGLAPGMKVAFLWFHAERHSNIQARERLGDNLVFLKWSDITLAWDPAQGEHDVTNIVSMGA